MSGLISTWRNWHERRTILRDVRQQQADAREWAYFRFKDAMTEALNALERDDHRHATEIWVDALGQYPGQALGSSLAFKVLLGLRRFDEAETLMNEGRRKRPADVRFAIGLARVALSRQDYEAAAQRWAAVRKAFPGAIEGYTFGSAALRELKHLAEAEALIRQTMSRFPDEIVGFMEHARLAELHQDWEQVLQRWDIVRNRFDHPSGYIGAIHAMVQLKRYDEAEALSENARVRFPGDPAPHVSLVVCSQAKGDMAQALSRCNLVAQRFPLHLPSVLRAAELLEQLDAAEEAEQVLRDAVDRFQAEPRPLRELGRFCFAAAARPAPLKASRRCGEVPGRTARATSMVLRRWIRQAASKQQKRCGGN